MPVVFDAVIIFPCKIVLISAKIPDSQTIIRSKEQFPFRFKQTSDAAKQRSGIVSPRMIGSSFINLLASFIITVFLIHD